MANPGTTTYPGTLDAFDNPGTATYEDDAGYSHFGLHSQVHDAIEAIQSVLGTNGGTSVLKNFTAGQFPIRVNSGGTMVQTVIGGTWSRPVIGTEANPLPTVAGELAFSTTSGALHLGNGVTTNVILDNTTSQAVSNKAFDGGTFASVIKFTPTVTTLTDAAGGTLAINAAVTPVAQLTIGTTAGNRTFGAPTNPTDGQSLVIRVKQNAANTGTLVWDSSYRFSDAGTPAAGTASTWNYYGWRYNADGTKWDFQGQSKNII